jgi:hypothetical protein
MMPEATRRKVVRKSARLWPRKSCGICCERFVVYLVVYRACLGRVVDVMARREDLRSLLPRCRELYRGVRPFLFVRAIKVVSNLRLVEISCWLYKTFRDTTIPTVTCV